MYHSLSFRTVNCTCGVLSTAHKRIWPMSNLGLCSMIFKNQVIFSTKLSHPFDHVMTLYIALSWLSSSNVCSPSKSFAVNPFFHIFALTLSQNISVQHQMIPAFTITGISKQIPLCFISGLKKIFLQIFEKPLSLSKHIFH